MAPAIRSVLFVTAMAIAAGSDRPAHAQDRARTARYERVGSFENPRIRESSGVAVSRRGGGYLWTHNDSGDGPTLYLTDLRGRDLGSLELEGATAVDWEDVAAGPCPGALTEPCLYVGDIGNNLGHREWVDVFVIVEPEQLEPEGASADPVHRLRVRYPDRPRDTEALAVGSDGSLWLVPKAASGRAEIFHVPAAAALRDSATARPAGSLGFAMVALFGRVPTGAAIAPDGDRLVVRTYTELYFFAWSSEGGWVPDGPPCWLGFADGQGEAVDFHPDGGVVLTAEGIGRRGGGIARAWCPDA